MPLVDMPLNELLAYQGSTPCPGDFDAYWDKAVAEMKAVDAKAELVPAAFQVSGAECFDLWFTGVGGARIHAKYVRPKNAPKPHPAVIQFHGYTGSAGEWWDKLAYVHCGFAVAALWDTGDADARRIARDMSDELLTSRSISNVAWGALVRAAGAACRSSSMSDYVVAAETPLRWVQWGWLE